MRQLKLQQPPRPRIRVRDLAREVGADDNDVLVWLRANGEWVKSVLSFVEQPVAQRVRLHFAPDNEQQRSSSPEEQADPPVRAPLQGLQPPTAPPARENNPFLGQLKAFSRREAPRPPRNTSPETVWHAEHETPDYSAAGSFLASPAMAPFEWALRGVDDTKQAWLDHGLTDRDARIAEACLAAGLQPNDLAVAVSGWTVLDRITRGEAPKEVARLLDRQRQAERDLG